MWSTFFDHTFNFSMAFDKFKRAITFFSMILLVFYYSHHFQMRTAAFDKLLQALITSKLKIRVLRDDEEWLMLLKRL